MTLNMQEPWWMTILSSTGSLRRSYLLEAEKERKAREEESFCMAIQNFNNHRNHGRPEKKGERRGRRGTTGMETGGGVTKGTSCKAQWWPFLAVTNQ
ncbi:PREDICTED: uncharacterized protein LOC106312493 isoform X2 [Brassica oleracea var. oleracea]|uniref:uncharacterized protein LOC106312493 isoform X2 n=1 Tax=Brassica oleracea var. oleracea TaxID=109376 RepID=UPI0006A6DE6C|nr:PREDICTED: uncharacterized protein LOC106312493 isoform X2 [Brassica oleracea var. oleracea]